MKLSEHLSDTEVTQVTVAMYEPGWGFEAEHYLFDITVKADDIRIEQDPDGGNYQLEFETDAGVAVAYPPGEIPNVDGVKDEPAYSQEEMVYMVKMTLAMGLPLVGEVFE